MANETATLDNLERKLLAGIEAAQKAAAKPIDPETISAIVTQVVSTLGGDLSAGDLKFYAELKDLAEYIRRAKSEIAAIKPKDISTSHIPRATDELDAVVGATEEATNKIMDVCDEISAIGGGCSPECNEKLVACTTRIFEACNFQDITGQRITKVVQTLKYIDDKVEALLRVFGEEVDRPDHGTHLHGDDPEKQLLNGPQLPQNAIDQSEIDKLMGN